MDQNNNQNSSIVDQKNIALASVACEIIADNLGESTAERYKEFYEDKESSVILASLEALLSELVGQRNARKQIGNKLAFLNKK
jgi:hypothetical protein